MENIVFFLSSHWFVFHDVRQCFCENIRKTFHKSCNPEVLASIGYLCQGNSFFVGTYVCMYVCMYVCIGRVVFEQINTRAANRNYKLKVAKIHTNMLFF